jgi:hypothetical protein
MKFTTDDELAKLEDKFSNLEQHNIILWGNHRMYYWFDEVAKYGLGPYPTAFGALQGAEAYIKDKYDIT